MTHDTLRIFHSASSGQEMWFYCWNDILFLLIIVNQKPIVWYGDMMPVCDVMFYYAMPSCETCLLQFQVVPQAVMDNIYLIIVYQSKSENNSLIVIPLISVPSHSDSQLFVCQMYMGFILACSEAHWTDILSLKWRYFTEKVVKISYY